MDNEFFNFLDYIYIFIVFLSTIVGLIRGFTKDFLSTCVWLGSGFLSTFSVPYITPFIETYIASSMMVRYVALGASFLIFVIFTSLIVGFISRHVRNSVFSGTDRTVGVLFGLLRGMGVPVCCSMMIVTLGIPLEKYQIIKESKFSVILFTLLEPPASEATTDTAKQRRRADVVSSLEVISKAKQRVKLTQKMAELKKSDLKEENGFMQGMVKDWITNISAKPQVLETNEPEKSGEIEKNHHRSSDKHQRKIVSLLKTKVAKGPVRHSASKPLLKKEMRKRVDSGNR